MALREFIEQAWHVVEPENPYVHGWHIDAICDHLEAVTSGDVLRLLINVPPGMMKSLTTCVFWPAWEWGPRNLPHYRYISASYKEDYAKRDCRRTLDLLRSSWYQERWGDRVTLKREGETDFENTMTGWRKSCPSKSFTGGRANRVIWDDPHSTESAESDAERKSVIRVLREALPTRLQDPKTTAIVIVMQRLHEGDASGEVLANDLGYVHLCLPMEFEPKYKCMTVIGFEDPRVEEGELLFEERFPRDVVERDKAAMTPYAVAGQFQQQPSPRKGGMFKTEGFKIIPDFDRSLVTRSVRYWDKAGTEGGGAYSAGVIMHKLQDGRQVIEDVQRGQWSSLVREIMIKQTAGVDQKMYPRVTIWIEQEPGSGGKESAENTVRRLAGFSVRVDRVTMSKEERAGVNDPVKARSYSAQVEAGNVLLVAADWNKGFIDEHGKFPTGKYKDQVDAASGAFNKLQAIDDEMFGSWETLKRQQKGMRN